MRLLHYLLLMLLTVFLRELLLERVCDLLPRVWTLYAQVASGCLAVHTGFTNLHSVQQWRTGATLLRVPGSQSGCYPPVACVGSTC